jgi:hypothetical protein
MEGVRYLICSCFLSGLLSLEDFSFAKTWVLPSCTFSPFCWVLYFIDDSQVFIKGRFLIKIKNRPTLVYRTHGKWPLNNHTKQHVAPTRYEAHQINVPFYR